MIQVKLFSGNTTMSIEKDINEFIADEANEVVTVVDVKMASSEVGARNINALLIYDNEMTITGSGQNAQGLPPANPDFPTTPTTP